MSPRLAAALALAQVLQGKSSLAGALPALLAKVPARDKALAQQLAFGTARWQPALALFAGKLLRKPFKASDRDLEALLLVGLYQLLHTRIPAHAAISETVNGAAGLGKGHAKGLLNAVLRNAQRSGPELQQALADDPVFVSAHPLWLLERLQQDWPDQWPAMVAANNAHPPFCLRVNRRLTGRDAYLEKLAEAGLEASACQWSADGIRLAEPCPVEQLPGFGEGWVSVQDEAAQLAAPLLQLAPGQRVLDACAAPGGKTCHMLEREPGLGAVLALDAESLRLQKVAQNLERLGLAAELVVADARDRAAWWDGQPFDRMLLDAPCSATGVIRRHPDIKLTRQRADIAPLAALQGQLLDALWPTLATGGVLLYATCSVLPQENTQIIGAFLERTRDARELPIEEGFGLAQGHGRQLLPQQRGADGFYYARLVKGA